ncbi:LTA synthase family protein [Stutzerimonas stutzeri]|uniref:LTA synthase family protein n=1 Tax=Stutzerimonas stutzeri TaxID=316 RepID=UPI001C2DFFAC|nr:LTA synthase family protein [Stutzerimonas stutzeri]
MSLLRHAQLRYLSLLLGLWLAVFVLTRSALLVGHWQEAGIGFGALPRVFGLGLIYDLAYLALAGVPLATYLLLCPQRLWASRWHRRWLTPLLGLSLYAMLLTAVAEWLFWDEFAVRFNFIAVDNLVYSDEVLNNVLESYPVCRLLALLAVLALGITAALRAPLRRALAAPSLSWRGRATSLAGMTVAALAIGLIVDQDFPRGTGGNPYPRELASNGPFQFFAAFRNNELDYPQFYATLPEREVGTRLRTEVSEPNARFLGDDPQDIRRLVDNPGTLRKLNIVLITVESLSANYLGSFGDARGLTPNLDRLRQQSLAFSRFYATGTRTDRGLEAITLSVPPTPGRSIVKRIGRESGFASLGQQLRGHGYDSVFLYGGRGYFDNLSAFFSGNGYRVVDQSSTDEADIHFKNAWGMADEDLYRLALREADADHALGKPFLLQLMTTSNHRPYTYPAGHIDIPSGESRDGAVKYTDLAIGQFLEQARTRPWFAQTLFVIVADHAAGSAGAQDLPVANYHIPLLIYGPGLVEPREMNTVASQIDIAPTLLGLLNLDYVSTFFGRNLLRDDAHPGRALIGNYQHLGLFDGNDLAILSPRREVRRHDNALRTSQETPARLDDALIDRAIAYSQGASYDYRHGLLRWNRPTPNATQLGHR